MKPETAKIENVGKEGRSTKFGISLKKKICSSPFQNYTAGKWTFGNYQLFKLNFLLPPPTPTPHQNIP